MIGKQRESLQGMGWIREGARHMGVCQANGHSVTNEYIRQHHTKTLPALTFSKERLETERKRLKIAREVFDNIPEKDRKAFCTKHCKGCLWLLHSIDYSSW